MWAARYWARRAWAPRYWAKAGATAPATGYYWNPQYWAERYWPHRYWNKPAGGGVIEPPAGGFLRYQPTHRSRRR
jgi:hypothetical protein